MLTFYHAPLTCSTRVLTLIAAMDLFDWIEIREVTVARFDGTGQRNPANPHPEGKVPLLVHDGVAVWESAAILLYLTDLFPDSPLDVRPATQSGGAICPGCRGTRASWSRR